MDLQKGSTEDPPSTANGASGTKDEASTPESNQGSIESRSKILLKKVSSILGHNDKLGARTSVCILVSFISIGYIIIPFGKKCLTSYAYTDTRMANILTLSLHFWNKNVAFSKGGVLLATGCLVLVSFQSYVLGTYVLEACARAEALMELESIGGEGGDVDQNEPETGDTPNHRDGSFVSSIRIKDRVFQLSELCRIFLGRYLECFFTFTTAGDLYGVTWALAVVFGSSFADKIPLGTKRDYELYVLIFLLICVPISCLQQISGQVRLQVLFLFCRTVMVLLMIGTLIAAYASNTDHFGTKTRSVGGDLPLADFTNLVSVMQICVFATAFQFSVPGIAAETEDKHSMISIIGTSVTYMFITNLILGLLMALYFGSDTQSSSNLNWVDYHGGTWDGENLNTRAWWASGISAYVVSFAALDGLAVYSLVAVSLGDIFMGAFYGDKMHEQKKRHWKRRGFRVLASLPQGIGAMFIRDLGAM